MTTLRRRTRARGAHRRRFAGFRLAVGHAVTRWTDGHGRVCALGELPLTCRLHRLNSIASTACIRKLRSNRPDAEIFTPDRSDRHGPAVAVAGCSRGMLTVSAIIEQAVEECGLAVETQRTKLCKRTWAFERRTRRGHREPAAGSESARRQRPRATGRTAVRWLSSTVAPSGVCHSAGVSSL